MEQLIDKLLDMGMGQFMDHSREELVRTDQVYLKDMEDEGELEQRFIGLDLPEEESILINDYIACAKSCGSRYADISYMAGIKDAVRMFACLGLLKDHDL